MKAYHEELLFVLSEDQLALEGVAIQPAADRKASAILWIHGNTGRFCDYPYIMIGRALAERGYLFVSANTRGHDIAASAWSDARMQMVAVGSAWEKLEDAPLDIGAWIDAIAKLGVEKVILAGHSQGAAKAVYYQAQRQDARVQGVVLASPDLHGHWSGVLEQARQLVAAGRGDELLPDFMRAPWYRLSAANVISRADVLNHVYTSDSGTPHIAALRCPLLAFFGTNHDVGGQTELDTLKAQTINAPQVDTCLIDGADHGYVEREAAVAETIAAWLASL
ncbi:MAG: alpha/beta fold hydrolase [Anaerolineae bacterium]